MSIIEEQEVPQRLFVSDSIADMNREGNSFLTNPSINMLCRDQKGQINSIEEYSEDGDLVKKINYLGTTIKSIEYYCFEHKYCHDFYEDNMCIQRNIYNKKQDVSAIFKYQYKKGNIVSITKQVQNKTIKIEYTYDVLSRIVARNCYVDNKKYFEQHYTYDVLDHIKKYKDNSKEVTITDTNDDNELLSYTVKDVFGNNKQIENHFDNTGYAYSQITTINDKYKIRDINYVDNVMLKKPYASESDLNMVINKLFEKHLNVSTNRKPKISMNIDNVISRNLNKNVLPISIRKLQLYQQSLN